MGELEYFCRELLERMEHKLLDLQLDHPKPAHWSQKAIPYLNKYLDQLQQYISAHPFQKRSEEIYFFKKVKPAVMAQLIFMCEVHNKELARPFNLAEAKDYLTDEADEIDAFFEKHEGLYNYYKEGADTLDIKYFVRDVEDRFSFRDLPIEIDPVFFYGKKDFSTGFDYLFAKFKAYEMLKDHLENEFEALFLVGDELPAPTLDFTGSPADFVMMVEMFNQIGMPPNPDTGQPFTEEELFQKLRSGLNIQLPEGMDFQTLKLISGDSNLPERMIESLDKLQKKWEDEEKDVDYNEGDEDKPIDL